MDPASIIGWLGKKAVEAALSRAVRASLTKRLRDACDKWRLELPAPIRANDIWARSLVEFDAEAPVGTAVAILSETIVERVPAESQWFDALLDRWRAVRGASDLVPFFTQGEAAAIPHLRMLAHDLWVVCASELSLALPTLVSAATHSASREPNANDEIDRAEAHLQAGRVEVASDILAALRSRRWECLSNRERYRVLALQGHAAMRQGKIPEASSLFTEAASHQPDLDKARAIGALGKMLAGREAEALAIAEDVLSRGPYSVAAVVFVSCSPSEMGVEEIEHALDPVLLQDADVARALAFRCRRAGNYAHAERHARAALAASPDALEAQAELARALIQSVVSRLTDAPTAIAACVRESLTEAYGLLTSAIARCPRGEESAQLRLDRSIALQILGDPRASDADVHEAFAIGPSLPMVAISEAELRASAGDVQGALDALVDAQSATPVRLLKAELLRRLGTSAAVRDAKRVLDQTRPSLGTADEYLRAKYCAEITAVCSALEQHEEARRLLHEMTDAFAPRALRLALLSTIAVAANDRRAAQELATQAVDSVTSNDSREVRRLVAVALERAGMLAAALALWRSIVDPRAPTADAHRLLACALKSGDDFAALEFCRAARAAGVLDDYLVEVHVTLCEKYNALPEAIDILQEREQAEKDEKRAAEFRIAAAYYALRLGRLTLAKDLATRIPAPATIDPHLARAAVEVLRGLGQFQGAVDFAYEVARLHPDDRDARIAYFDALGFSGGHELPPLAFDSVTTGCAVRARLDGADRDEWYIVLDRTDVSVSRREFRPSHPHIAAMIGKGPGDRFVVPGPIQSQSGTIQEVVSKESLMLTQLLSTWSVAFPEDHTVIPMRLETGTTPQEQLAPMLRLLDEKHRIGTELVDLYRREAIPVFSVARRLVRGTSFDCFLAFAADPSIPIRCCDSSEFSPGIRRALSAAEVVADPTALATLFLFGAEELLDTIGIRILITEGTLQELRQSPLLEDNSRRKGAVAKVGDGYVAQESDPGEAANARARLVKFVSLVESKCIRVPGDALAKLPVGPRSTLPDVIGIGSAEALAVAVDRRCCLWTDDFAIARIASGDVRVERLTTQWLALTLEATGHIASPIPELIAIGMLRHGFVTVAVNGAAMSYAIRTTRGDSSAEPLRSVLSYMESSNVQGPGLAAAVATSLAAATHDKNVAPSVLRALAGRLRPILKTKNNGDALCALVAAELRRTVPDDGLLATAFATTNP